MTYVNKEWIRDMDLIYIDCLVNGLPLPIEWGFTDKGFGPTKYREINNYSS